MHIGLLLRSVGASGREGNFDVVPGLFRSFFDGDIATENDQVSERNLLALVAIGLRLVELLLNRFELRQDLGQLRRLVDFPILLRGEANACAVCSSALV